MTERELLTAMGESLQPNIEAIAEYFERIGWIDVARELRKNYDNTEITEIYDGEIGF